MQQKGIGVNSYPTDYAKRSYITFIAIIKDEKEKNEFRCIQGGLSKEKLNLEILHIYLH